MPGLMTLPSTGGSAGLGTFSSSQNPQGSRWISKASDIPVLSQEALQDLLIIVYKSFESGHTHKAHCHCLGSGPLHPLEGALSPVPLDSICTVHSHQRPKTNHVTALSKSLSLGTKSKDQTLQYSTQDSFQQSTVYRSSRVHGMLSCHCLCYSLFLKMLLCHLLVDLHLFRANSLALLQDCARHPLIWPPMIPPPNIPAPMQHLIHKCGLDLVTHF